MEGIIKIRASDLVLRVKHNFDPTKLDLDSWNNYLDCLCGTRDYQKEAIKTAIIYMASGNYIDINQLAVDNYAENSSLREKYKTRDDLIKHIPLPNKLSGVIDLATGTGKSYVMFGIAQIMLSLGLVNRVLLLCPSVTIERELRKKFKTLSAKKDLKLALPVGSLCANPSIIDASSTICPGDICIENIHAVYDNSATSIKDSFASGGEDTLVLSDEVHHAYNSSSEKDIRKWKGFLTSKYNFHYVMGFTGTAYVGNEYFVDVIYRYSLRQAIEDKVIKSVEYISRDDASNTHEKLQMIYDNHLEFRRKNTSLKPLSIFVAKDIKSATNLSLDFIDFLVDVKRISREDAEKMVIVVTSAPKHKKNVDMLLSVDDKNNPVEWIFSVSMLTEGWDAKNVFQIVPWEDRAFNSKLLIAQVLGRGLRIPEGYTTQPKVRVFNHASWSKNIQTLVDEVLDIDLELTSRVITHGDRSMFNFDIHTLNYTQEERASDSTNKKTHETFDLTKKVVLISQTPQDKKKTEYEDINRKTHEKTTIVQREMIHVNDIVNRIIESFRGRALEARLVFPEGQYEKDNLPSVDVIRNYILDSMQACGIKGEYLSSENANKIYGKFTGLLRRKPATPIFVRKGGTIRTINTSSMKASSKSASMLTKDITLFTSNDYRKELTEDELDAYLAIKEEMRTRQIHEENAKCLKTPMSIVFTQYDPERRFTEMLVSSEISPHIDAWIKSRDVGFYSIEYQLNKGSAFQEFNPDFFILSGDCVAVVETKSDGDDSNINCAKYRAAKRHFELLNKALEAEGNKRRYFFYFLSPVDFNTFADYLSDGRLFSTVFHSKLMELLEKKIELLGE